MRFLYLISKIYYLISEARFLHLISVICHLKSEMRSFDSLRSLRMTGLFFLIAFFITQAFCPRADNIRPYVQRKLEPLYFKACERFNIANYPEKQLPKLPHIPAATGGNRNYSLLLTHYSLNGKDKPCHHEITPQHIYMPPPAATLTPHF